MSNIESLIDRISDFNDSSNLDELCQAIKNEQFIWFYALDEGQFKECSEIVLIGKNNPIKAPYQSIDGKYYFLMYPSRENLSLNPLTGFRQAKIRGRDIYSFVSKIKLLHGALIQGKKSWVAIPMDKVKEYV